MIHEDGSLSVSDDGRGMAKTAAGKVSGHRPGNVVAATTRDPISRVDLEAGRVYLKDLVDIPLQRRP